MPKKSENAIRLARPADAHAFGALLHRFNIEFSEPTPPAEVIAERAAPLIASGEVTVLFAGEGPDGFAELRFRPSLYTRALDAISKSFTFAPSVAVKGSGARCSRQRWSWRGSGEPLASTSTRA
jgi:hypothetical protein